MNSKYVQMFTVGTCCACLVCAGTVTYFVNSRKAGTVRVESRDEFLAVNQDLLPQTVETIADSQGESFLNALFTGKEIPNTDTDICIWASSDEQVTQGILEDTSLDLKLHYNKENDEMITQVCLSENGNETFSMNVNLTGDKAGIYCPQIDQNFYTLSKDQFLYGLGTVTGFGTGNVEDQSDNDNAGDETDSSDVSDNSDESAKLDESELAEMLNIILTAVTQDNIEVISDSTVCLSHFGEDVSGTTYVCTPGSKDFQSMLIALADYMDTHENARNYVHNMLGKASLFNYRIGKLEKLLVNEDGSLRDNAKSIADKLAKKDFNWTVNSDENGTGRNLSLSFTVENTRIELTCEKSLSGGTYISFSLDDSFISFTSIPEISGTESRSSFGLSYGKTTITAGGKDHSSDIVVTTSKMEDGLTDETLIEFNGGSNIGNIELHIESKASSSAMIPEVSEEFQKDMTLYSDEEVLNLFKTYKNGLTSILLSSKLMGIVL